MAATAKKLRQITMVCDTCGSDDVRLDAWAAWNVETPQWELAETFDLAHCAHCDGECSIVERAQP
jgi:hypothetical protein